jgi:ElaB/YqjD/DUF883 family membrane-anchored ribosome-binding protein
MSREINDSSILAIIVERLDIAVEKLTEVSRSISQMLAVHENRIDTQEKVSDQLTDLIEQRRKEANEDIKELHSRITTTTRELSDKIDDTEKKVLTKLAELQSTPSPFYENKYIYMGIGGLIAITWILEHIDLSTLGHLVQK